MKTLDLTICLCIRLVPTLEPFLPPSSHCLQALALTCPAPWALWALFYGPAPSRNLSSTGRQCPLVGPPALGGQRMKTESGSQHQEEGTGAETSGEIFLRTGQKSGLGDNALSRCCAATPSFPAPPPPNSHWTPALAPRVLPAPELRLAAWQAGQHEHICRSSPSVGTHMLCPL